MARRFGSRGRPFGAHTLQPDWLAEYALKHQGVDVHHTVLQQVQSQHGGFLVLKPVGRDIAAAAIENEIVGAIPGFKLTA
jgi:hypothetical protein